MISESRSLIDAMKRGDIQALRTIYDRYHPELLRLAAALWPEVHTAQDIVQDVFIRLYQGAGHLDDSANLGVYLRCCVVNAVRDTARKHKLRQAAALGSDPPDRAGGTPLMWVVIREDYRRLYAALSHLPLEQREVLILRCQQRWTFRQIAETQSVSVNTVQGRWRYGLERLRELMGNFSEDLQDMSGHLPEDQIETFRKEP